MDNNTTSKYEGNSLVGTSAPTPNEQRSPLADALQTLDKALANLELNIESLDLKLQPLQLRLTEEQKAVDGTSDHPPRSAMTDAILETAQRVSRNAQKVRKITNDLEL